MDHEAGMDHETVEEGNVVERYVTGKLEPEEEALFEEHYLDCASCIDAVEDAERLHRGLGRIAAEETVRALATRRLALFAWGRSRTIAMAALVVLAVLPAGWQFRQSSRLRQQLEAERRPQVNTPIFSLTPFRSSGLGEAPVHQITLAPEPEWILLSLEPGSLEYPLYRATLFDAEEDVVWKASGLVPNYLGAFWVSVHSSFLPPGEYDLALAGLPDGAGAPVSVARFPMRVTGPPP